MEETYDCPGCGLKGAQSTCSSNAVMICNGHLPEPGCCRILTAEERHYYGACCETCELRWSDRIEAWRKGATDGDLDAMFDARPIYQ